MPKRKINDKLSYYQDKIRRLKEKSNKKRQRVIIYSSTSDSENNDDGTTQAEENTTEFAECHVTNTEQLVDISQRSPETVSELHPDLLLALGDAEPIQPIFGDKVHQSLVQRLEPILKNGLATDCKTKLLKEFNVPENCKLLKAPTLNPEISAALTDVTRNRDQNIQAKQEQLGIGITAVSRAITLLLLNDDKIQAIKILTDGCRLLSDLHHTETQVRKKLITPILEKSVHSVIKDQDRDETLFGNDLAEKIKATKAIEKQGQQIKKMALSQKISTLSTSTPYSSTPSTSRQRLQGNGTGPSRYLSTMRGGRGGPARAAPASYRRAAPAHAAAAYRPPASYSTRQRVHNRR